MKRDNPLMTHGGEVKQPCGCGGTSKRQAPKEDIQLAPVTAPTEQTKALEAKLRGMGKDRVDD